MRTSRLVLAALGVASAAVAASAGAQQPAQPAAAQQKPPSRAPAVGSVAPDFSLPGATRYGLLDREVRLSDYRGKTVVLAFFFKARTKG